MKKMALGLLTVGVIFFISSPVGAEILNAKVELKKVSGQCVSSAEVPSKAASRRGDRIRWTLKNTDCPGSPKVQFSVLGVPRLFDTCRKGASGSGGEVDLTGSPITVKSTLTLVCPVAYVTVLGPLPHHDGTPPKRAQILIRDTTGLKPECAGPPPEGPDRAEWLKKCRSAELELEVVP